MTKLELAAKISEYVDYVDPWSFSDAFDSMEDAVSATLRMLEEDPIGILEYLEGCREYDYDEDTGINLETLISALKEVCLCA